MDIRKGIKEHLGLIAVIAAVFITIIVIYAVNAAPSSKAEYSLEEQRIVLDEIMDKVADGVKPIDLVEFLERELPRMERIHAAEAVHLAILGMGDYVDAQQQRFNAIAKSVAEEIQTNDIDFSNPSEWSKIKDKYILTFLEEATRNYVLFTERDGYLVAEIDLARLLDIFKTYQTDDFKTYYDARLLHMQKSYIVFEQPFDFDLAAERLIDMETVRLKLAGTFYEPAAIYLQKEIYEDFFSLSYMNYGDLVFGEDENTPIDVTYSPQVRGALYAVYQRYPNTFLGEDIQAFLTYMDSDEVEPFGKPESITRRHLTYFEVPNDVSDTTDSAVSEEVLGEIMDGVDWTDATGENSE